MGQDRSLDEEGIPDLEGPLPEKVATGDPQEGVSPPADRPNSFDFGVTVDEQREGEPIGVRVARERPDVFEDPVFLQKVDDAIEGDDPVQLVADDTEGATFEDAELVDSEGTEGVSAEEAALHIVDP